MIKKKIKKIKSLKMLFLVCFVSFFLFSATCYSYSMTGHALETFHVSVNLISSFPYELSLSLYPLPLFCLQLASS